MLGSLLTIGLGGLGGCSSANKKLDEFADRACECKDMECGAKVTKDFIAWAQENQSARGDEDQAKKSISRMQECITKLRSSKKVIGDKAEADKKMDAEKAEGDKKMEADKAEGDKDGDKKAE